MPSGNEKDFLRFMSRHVVVLTGEYESFMQDGTLLHRGVFVFSGSLRSRYKTTHLSPAMAAWVSAMCLATERRVRFCPVRRIEIRYPQPQRW
jgi:hypothetical protein